MLTCGAEYDGMGIVVKMKILKLWMYITSIQKILHPLFVMEKLKHQSSTVGVPALRSRVQRNFWLGDSDSDHVNSTNNSSCTAMYSD